jgi:protein-tyrosine phosphatase
VDAFTIVFVCTGNRFRSPLAAAFVKRLTKGLPVEVESYGTLRLDGLPPLPEALQIGDACGVSLSEHRTRCVDHAALETADLVLGFEPHHVYHAVVDGGALRERSFLLDELVSILSREAVEAAQQDVIARARALVASAAGRREAVPETRGMRDPFGQPWKVYRRSAADVRELSLALVQALFRRFDADALPPVPERVRKRRLVWR